jgi:hypothetical protein
MPVVAAVAAAGPRRCLRRRAPQAQAALAGRQARVMAYGAGVAARAAQVTPSETSLALAAQLAARAVVEVVARQAGPAEAVAAEAVAEAHQQLLVAAPLGWMAAAWAHALVVPAAQVWHGPEAPRLATALPAVLALRVLAGQHAARLPGQLAWLAVSAGLQTQAKLESFAAQPCMPGAH